MIDSLKRAIKRFTDKQTYKTPQEFALLPVAKQTTRTVSNVWIPAHGLDKLILNL